MDEPRLYRQQARFGADPTYRQYIKLTDDGWQAYDSQGWESRHYAREADAEVACDDRLATITKEDFG
jgi:hypothetical protein